MISQTTFALLSEEGSHFLNLWLGFAENSKTKLVNEEMEAQINPMKNMM